MDGVRPPEGILYFPLLELLPELQEQFWLRVLLGGLRNRDNIIQQKEFLDLDFNTDTPCAIAEIQIDLDEKVTKKYYAEKNSRYNLLNNIFFQLPLKNDEAQLEY